MNDGDRQDGLPEYCFHPHRWHKPGRCEYPDYEDGRICACQNPLAINSVIE